MPPTLKVMQKFGTIDDVEARNLAIKKVRDWLKKLTKDDEGYFTDFIDGRKELLKAFDEKFVR
jgi:RNA-binding protein YlmH